LSKEQKVNLPAYLHTIPLLLNVKQESCEYQLRGGRSNTRPRRAGILLTYKLFIGV